jgi:Ohr subfamily peroxiredoxin
MSSAAKLLFTGKTHVTSGPDGAAHANDGSLDIKLAQPHPAAENLFAAAWSACYMGAIELAAGQRKIKLAGSPEVNAEIDLNNAGGSFFLRARLNVTVPGVERAVAEELAAAAHDICPYSKAVHGNIDVATNVL